MPTVQELTELYRDHTDYELYVIAVPRAAYSPEAREAAQVVINERGGNAALIHRLKTEAARAEEIAKLTQTAALLLKQGNPPAEIQKQLSSALLSPEDIATIVESVSRKRDLEKKDVAIAPRTIIGSIVGGLLAGTVSGLVLGTVAASTHRIFGVFVMGTVVACHGFIRVLTKQSSRNNVVLIATALSVLYAFLIAVIVYHWK